MREVSAGSVAGYAFGCLLGSTGSVTADGLAVEGHAEFASISIVAEGGVGHEGEEGEDECHPCHDW